jgi:tripartite-type tricarboxylate transporter receptor subunit TctC
MLRGQRLLAMLVLAAALTVATAASAQSPEEFYKNKEIRMLISDPAGGGYDLYARFFARHVSRFLPGNPTIVPQNMPGGAGVVMASYLYASAPQDGTVIGLGPGSTGTAALFGSPGARYDARKFCWIGSMTSDVAVSLAWHTAAVKTAKDLFTTELITGGAGATDQSVMYPVALSRILGMKFKVITGYGGTADTSLAMERGETFGIGAMNFSSIQANKPDWLREKKVNLLVQLSLNRHPGLPDVPTALELTRTDDEREILRLIVAQSTMARAIYGPPNIPVERLQLLRSAFDRLMKDREFLAEAEKLKIELNQPMSGEEMSEFVNRLYAAKPDLVSKARDAIGTK